MLPLSTIGKSFFPGYNGGKWFALHILIKSVKKSFNKAVLVTFAIRKRRKGGGGKGGEDDNEKKLHTNPSSSTVLIFKLLQELVSADVSFYSTYMNRTSCFDQLSTVY